MLTANKTGTSAQYAYDAFNRRIKRTVTGTGANTTYFIYDGDKTIEERNAAGQMTEEYAWGLLARF